jgi:NADH:ubiquinone oxidoreductase subunit K
LALAGVLLRRSLFALLVGVQGMFVAVALALVGFARMRAGEAGLDTAGLAEAQGFALLILVVGAAELALGLSIAVASVRQRGSANVDGSSALRW